jgi:hypothetical protein
MEYRELDINGRINLKGTYEQFLKIAIAKFRESQEKKIYRTRSRGKKALTRSRNLYNRFDHSAAVSSGGTDVLKINFLMYGRFVDMGVGKGTSMNRALLRKKYSIHRPDVPRKPLRWYSKTKSHQEKRLAEILAKRYGQGMIKLAETLLNNTVTIPL